MLWSQIVTAERAWRSTRDRPAGFVWGDGMTDWIAASWPAIGLATIVLAVVAVAGVMAWFGQLRLRINVLVLVLAGYATVAGVFFGMLANGKGVFRRICGQN